MDLLLFLAFARLALSAPQWQTWWTETSYERPTQTWTWESYASTPATSPSVTTTVSTSTTSTSVQSPSNNACASVSMLSREFRRTATASATPTVPADLAYDCLNSIPFHAPEAVKLMDSITPYLEWQTTLQYVEDPPAEYAEKVQAPYNFYANWDRIYATAQAGGYASEYAFGFDLYRCFQQVHDGHFVYYPDSVTEIFSFGRTTPIVSVSADGMSIPEVYVYADILAASGGNLTWTPSPLTQIDGQDSTTWLLNFSEYGSLQDPDALWNNMMYIPAQVSLGPYGTGMGTFAGGGRGRWPYPGASTTLTFANGTSVTNANFANILAPSFHGIKSGEDIYKKYFTPPKGQPQPVSEIAHTFTFSSSSYPAAPTTTMPAPGYPSPIVREANNFDSGYFLSGEGYDDVAVLAVPSFVGTEADEKPFQEVDTYFLNQAVAQGKTKLIIDVSANAGGTILQGYDLFKQLFPSILPYGATRFRAHEAFNLIGEEISYYSGLVPRSLSDNDTALACIASSWNYRTDVDINYQNFNSWAEKYGPYAYGPAPDNYTSIIRWNLSDVLTPYNSGGIWVSGYGPRSNITTQPFAAEDIVIVYDGYCASTCTIFSELMTSQGGVKTIALGGRPTTDIIQAVGGVKGTNDYPYSYILYGAEQPFEIAHYHNASYYNTTVLGSYNDLAILRATDSVVNARDGIAPDDPDEVPLQFIYQPADCRIFYTPDMVMDQEAVWKTVADTAFNGVDHCVAGGLPAKKKRDGMDERLRERQRHRAKRGVVVDEHLRALRETAWTGRGGKRSSGDAIMIP